MKDKIEGLNEKQSLFVHEYLVDRNATRAAIRAGYSEKTAESQGNRLLGKARVKKFIVAKTAERIERVQIDADYVLMQLGDMQQATVDQILNEDGTMKLAQEWPTVWQRMINGIDVRTSTDKDGVVTVEHRVKLMNRATVMKMLGDHVDVGAFQAPVHNGDIIDNSTTNVQVNLGATARAARVARIMKLAMVQHQQGKLIEGEKK